LQCVSVLTAYFVLLCEIAHTHAEFNRPSSRSGEKMIGVT
jgi:hypothetical protein